MILVADRQYMAQHDGNRRETHSHRHRPVCQAFGARGRQVAQPPKLHGATLLLRSWTAISIPFSTLATSGVCVPSPQKVGGQAVVLL